MKKNNHLVFVILAFLSTVFILSSCGKQTCSCLTIAPPDITLTGPKTSIERQIIGNYREIEKDAWLIASAKGDIGDTVSSPGETSFNQKESRMFASFSIMEKNRMKMIDFQKQGIIGENNRGYLEKISDKLDKEESAKLEIINVILAINRARRNMYEILLQEVKGADLTLEKIGRRYAKKYQGAAPAGSSIQLANGKWAKK